MLPRKRTSTARLRDTQELSTNVIAGATRKKSKKRQQKRSTTIVSQSNPTTLLEYNISSNPPSQTPTPTRPSTPPPLSLYTISQTVLQKGKEIQLGIRSLNDFRFTLFLIKAKLEVEKKASIKEYKTKLIKRLTIL